MIIVWRPISGNKVNRGILAINTEIPIIANERTNGTTMISSPLSCGIDDSIMWDFIENLNRKSVANLSAMNNVAKLVNPAIAAGF